MHNKQHLQINNNTISKLAVVVLSIILITGIFFIPVLQAGVYAQQTAYTAATITTVTTTAATSKQQQQNRVGLSQVIRQIAQQVATANPGTNETNVYQILVQLAKQTAAQTSSQEEAIKEISQISSQVTTYPFGTLSQVLSHFARLIASGNSSVAQIVQQTLQQKASSGSSNNITQSLSNTAIQEASSGSTNVNLVIRNAAQILANRVGVPVEKVEAVIIQMALQFAQAQGKAITGQYIFQLANQIIQDPNGVLAQAILQLVKQYMIDNGKTIQTVNIIKNVIKTGGSSSKTIVKVFERDGGGGQNQTIPTPPKDDVDQNLSSRCRVSPIYMSNRKKRRAIMF